MVNTNKQHDEAHVLHLKYRPDIDGLRAIAILSVLAFHLFPSALPGGFIGVDVFFVISGYLISSIIFRNLEHDSFSLADFYRRRIRRIFPALILVLFTSFLFGWFALFSGEYASLGKHVAGGATFIANLVLWTEAGYFDTDAITKPLLHLWSLGVEEQFYMAWPILIWLFWKSRNDFLKLTLIAGLTSLVYSLYASTSNPAAAFYSPLSRFWELMLGSLLAYLSLRHSHLLKAKTANLRAWLGIGLVLLGFVTISHHRAYPSWWALLPTLGAALLISASTHAWVNQRLLGNKAVVGIGLISYPLYLWHWPLISFATIIESGTPSVAHRFLLLVLSFVLAYLSYVLLEKPIRKRKSDMAIVSLVVAMLVVGYLGFNDWHRLGYDFREKAVMRAVAGYQTQRDESCNKRYEKYGLTFCKLHDEAKPIEVALVGDSHANQHWLGMSDYFSKTGINLVNVGWAGMKPLYLPKIMNKRLDQYGRALDELLDEIAHTQSIKMVVLSMAQPAEYDATFDEGLRAVVGLMQRNGKQVVFILDNPHLPFHPSSCVGMPPIRPVINKECVLPVSAIEPNYFTVREKIKNTLQKMGRVEIVDPLPKICDSQNCRIRRGNLFIYENTGYVSPDGDLYLFEDLKLDSLPNELAK